MNKYIAFKIHLSPGGKRETIGGVSFATFPSVILVEGVHHGAIGEATMYPGPVLAASAKAWEGVPVFINHPQDQQGAYVSGKHQQVQGQAIGHLSSVVFQAQGAKLTGLVFLNIAQVQRKQPGLLTGLENGKQMEVSTGLFGEEIKEAGIWRTEKYASRLTAIQPDHLALLPDGTGACSWQDGCGVRANHNNSPEERAYIPRTITFNSSRGENAMATEEAYLGPPQLFAQNSNEGAVNRAIRHINVTHGAGATSKIRSMSGAELVLLGEKLAKGGQQGAPAPASSSGEESPLTMPVLFGGAR